MTDKHMMWCLPCEAMHWRKSNKGKCPRCKGDLFYTGYAETVDVDDSGLRGSSTVEVTVLADPDDFRDAMKQAVKDGE